MRFAIVAALVIAASCKKAPPSTSSSDPPPPAAPARDAAVDAASDAAAAATDAPPEPAGSPVSTPEPPLIVKPGELRLLVALRRKLSTNRAAERADVAAVDLSGTARGDTPALAFAALDHIVRVQLRALVDQAGLGAMMDRLDKLAELRTEKDLEPLDDLLFEINDAAEQAYRTGDCKSEGCPEVPLGPVTATRQSVTALRRAVQELRDLLEASGGKPRWTVFADAIGEAFLYNGQDRLDALTGAQFLERLAARAR